MQIKLHDMRKNKDFISSLYFNLIELNGERGRQIYLTSTLIIV